MVVLFADNGDTLSTQSGRLLNKAQKFLQDGLTMEKVLEVLYRGRQKGYSYLRRHSDTLRNSLSYP